VALTAAGSGSPTGTGRRLRVGPSLALLPFLAFVGIFLIVPTVTVIVQGFMEGGRFSLSNIETLFTPTVMRALWKSVLLSASTAVVGAAIGAVASYLVVSGNPDGLLRRAAVSVSGVLAQFGGVTLAFAWITTVGLGGMLQRALESAFGYDVFGGSGWLYDMPGLILVYSYFQIPLMVIVFLPALNGLRPQWREAAINLGASTWQFWRQVGIPVLTPPFLASTLLLFANAFAAYATAAILVSQGQIILPLMIRAALTSEVVLGQQNLAFALALEMVVVVAVVMWVYNWYLKRAARWLQ
jgi:putative spermidine/putrescine transport system permease protein